DGEAGPVGVGAGDGRSGVGDGGADGLVGDEQGVDLLLDAVWGAGAQDAAAEDGGFELEVAGLYLPAFVVEGDDLCGGVAGGVGQSGDQTVAAGGAAGAGGDGDLCVDDPDRDAAEGRQPVPVGEAVQDRQCQAAVPGADADQEVRLGRGDLRG